MVGAVVIVGVIVTFVALLIAMDKLRNRRRNRLWASGKYGAAGFGAGAVGGCAAGGGMGGGCAGGDGGGGPGCGGGGG